MTNDKADYEINRLVKLLDEARRSNEILVRQREVAMAEVERLKRKLEIVTADLGATQDEVKRAWAAIGAARDHRDMFADALRRVTEEPCDHHRQACEDVGCPGQGQSTSSLGEE